MEKISPKERFNQNEKSVSLPPEILREALRKFGWNSEAADLRQLSGGFMNANFLATEAGKRIVLRVYASDAHTAQREFDLLRFLENHPISTPKALQHFEVQGRPVVFLEFLDGLTLEDRILSGGPIPAELYGALGRELGEIHKIHFESAGFLGPALKVSPKFDNFSRFIGEFVLRTLKDLENRPDRLDLETNRRFRRLVEDKWEMVVRSEHVPQLVHCDFNPKNILVSKDNQPKVLGVIDWEFSSTGNGLIDLGNFFRFAYDYPVEAKDQFIAGYRSVNPNLSPDWEAASRMIDLGNMCGFLERREDYQKSFRTARAVVKGTLEYFGY